MNLGVFVSSYVYVCMYIYIYVCVIYLIHNIHIFKKYQNYSQMSHSFRHDDPQRPTERTPSTQVTNDFFLTTF